LILIWRRTKLVHIKKNWN